MVIYMPNKQIITEANLRVCPYQTQDATKVDCVGSDGIVCRISPTHVAKIPLKLDDPEFDPHWRKICNLYDLIREYKIAKCLDENKLDPAKPYGIFKVGFRGEQRPAYVMEYLEDHKYNIPFSDYPDKLLAIKEEYSNKIKVAKKLGFIIKDEGIHNGIWAQKTDKVHLIDFMRWEIDPNSGLQEILDNIEVEI